MSIFNKASEKSLVRSFIEYSTIYFPEGKVIELFDSFQGLNIDMSEQEDLDDSFLEAQNLNLKKRSIPSKKNIKRWAETSAMFEQLLELTKEVLNEMRPSMRSNKFLRHLIKVTRYFTSS